MSDPANLTTVFARLTPVSRWVKSVLIFLLWTLIGLSFASQFYLSSSLAGSPVTWSQALSFALADWYTWAALSVLIVTLCRAFPLTSRGWSRPLLIHLTASIFIALAYAFLRALVAQAQNLLIGDPIPFAEAMQPLLFKTYHFNFMVYWVIAAIAHAVRYYRAFHERERATLELERHLSEARLQALRMQLNPHFLFNAMHSISALMHKDVEAADSMLARLSELLRLSLKHDNAQTLPLSQELDILKRYLDIERVRFKDRLNVRFEIASETLDLQVPSLILQPVVENALRHGIAPHARSGDLCISSRLEGQQLVLQTCDNGGGLSEPVREGIGISNTRRRLAELYGEKGRFEIVNRTAQSGACARISLPAIPSAEQSTKERNER